MRQTATERARWLGYWLLGLTFLIAAASKLVDADGFAGHLSDFGLLPEGILLSAAYALILAEVATGLGMLAQKRWALAATSLQLVVFSIVLGYGIVRGLDIDCGCLPFAESLQSALVRDLIMLALCAFLWFTERLRP